MGQVSIVSWVKSVRTCFHSKCFVWKIMETRQTLYYKLTKSIQHFSNDEEKFYVLIWFILTRSSIFHINSLSCAKWPSGYSVTEFLYWTGPLKCEFESRYWIFHFSFFVLIKYAFFIDLIINICIVILK